MTDAEAIPRRESLTVEFKSALKNLSKDKIFDQVVGFANTDGGRLYIGIEDNGEVTGVVSPYDDPVKMQGWIADHTRPFVAVRACLLNIGMKKVMEIEVSKSPDIVATTAGKTLHRRLKADGSPECIPLYPYEMLSHLSSMSRIDYSERPILGASVNDFDIAARQRLQELVRANPMADPALKGVADEELDKALGFVSHTDKGTVPTVAGLLMLGTEEAIQRHLPNHLSDLQVLDGSSLRSEIEFRGPLVRQIEALDEALKPWNPVQELEIGFFSQFIPRYDHAAIREAIVNAFGHRDYSVFGRVRVEVSDTGLTVTSPGSFIEGVTIENLITVEPHGRNDTLMNALKRVGLAERTGRGIDRIFEGSLRAGRPAPDYSESTSAYVRIFIPSIEPDEAFVRMIIKEQERLGNQLSLYSLMVLDALKGNPKSTIDDLSYLLNMTKGRVQRELAFLDGQGMLEVSGRGQNRSYMLSHELYRAFSDRAAHIRQRGIDQVRYAELILTLAEKEGSITRRDVEDLLRVPAPTATYHLGKLMKDGLLEKRGAGRSTYYVKAETYR